MREKKNVSFIKQDIRTKLSLAEHQCDITHEGDDRFRVRLPFNRDANVCEKMRETAKQHAIKLVLRFNDGRYEFG
jgi:hypothetical protein